MSELGMTRTVLATKFAEAQEKGDAILAVLIDEVAQELVNRSDQIERKDALIAQLVEALTEAQFAVQHSPPGCALDVLTEALAKAKEQT